MYVWIWRHLPGPLARPAAAGAGAAGGGLAAAAVRRVPVDRAAPAHQPGDGADEMTAVRVLVVDNYDSFVYNLVQYLGQLGADVVVRRNDAVTPADLDALGVDGVLISPGPGTPQDAGAVDGVRRRRAPTPRCRCSACASGTRRSARCSARRSCARRSCCTARRATVVHDGTGVLAGLPSPFTATRYHSLAVTEPSLPAEIVVTGRTRVRHRDGAAAPDAADRGRAVPPGVGADPGRAPDARELAAGVRARGGRRAGRARSPRASRRCAQAPSPACRTVSSSGRLASSLAAARAARLASCLNARTCLSDAASTTSATERSAPSAP